MAQLTRPKSSWELRAEAAESSLSAIRALVQQWREEAFRAEGDGWGLALAPDQEIRDTLVRCANELEALCPAPPEDQP